MTDADHYTHPERSAELMKARRAVKRYEAFRQKNGNCAVCRFRSLTETAWGRVVCRVGQQRVYPACEADGKGLRFEIDVDCLEQFRDKAA